MLYYEVTAGCRLGWVGSSAAHARRPFSLIHPGSRSGVAALSTFPARTLAARITLTGPIRIPCSVVPPPRSLPSMYRSVCMRSPFLLLPWTPPRRRLVVSARPAYATRAHLQRHRRAAEGQIVA